MTELRRAPVDPLLLTVYIPTYGRPELCLMQVKRIREAGNQSLGQIRVKIVVSINGDDSYSETDLLNAGADECLVRKANLGGNANIALGFEYLQSTDYLWILSDDDIPASSAFGHILTGLRIGVDLVSASWRDDCTLMPKGSGVHELVKEGAFIGLVSANVLSGRAFGGPEHLAFDGILTSYPHAYFIGRVLSDRELNCLLVPMSEFLDHSRSLAGVTGMNRFEAGAAQGMPFFGGGMLAATIATTSFDGRAFRAWWWEHWHRASMYRLAGGTQRGLVDRLARASLGTLLPYVLSLAPWWKLKERWRPRA